MTILLYVLGTALVIIGLIGIVLPALPGHVLILAGLIVAAVIVVLAPRQGVPRAAAEAGIARR